MTQADLHLAELTVPGLLDAGAARWAQQPLVRCAGIERTFAGMRDRVAAHAGSLVEAGVEPGDRVAFLAANRLELLELVLACGWSGAIAVPINAASRGEPLAHVLDNADPRLLVVERDRLEALDALARRTAALERIWVLETPADSNAGTPVSPHDADPGTTFTILHTSGTTGPSKGVECPHAQFYWWGRFTGAALGVREGDILYTVLPLFHTNALNTFFQALVWGGTYVLGTRFSASRFVQELHATGATVTYLLGAMAQILLKSPPSELDRAHRVRIALCPATPADTAERFTERFGIELVDGYGSTETNFVFSNRRRGEYLPGTMGRVLDGFEARVVDAQDCDQPDGVPGELVIRQREPYSMASGYFGMPDATVAAWRNLWFHTGDRVVRDERGVFRFVDRMKDAIRRRGENISSFDVEQALLAHPGVAGVAVVGVPSELGEEEVLAFVVGRESAAVSPVELIRHLEPRLPYFAVPRYLELVDRLPLTENGKVRKQALRARGVTETTWDREAAGIVLSR